MGCKERHPSSEKGRKLWLGNAGGGSHALIGFSTSVPAVKTWEFINTSNHAVGKGETLYIIRAEKGENARLSLFPLVLCVFPNLCALSINLPPLSLQKSPGSFMAQKSHPMLIDRGNSGECLLADARKGDIIPKESDCAVQSIQASQSRRGLADPDGGVGDGRPLEQIGRADRTRAANGPENIASLGAINEENIRVGRCD